MRTLRTDQDEALEALRDAVRQRERRIAMQAPCGWGKTVLASGIVEGAREKKKRALIIVSAISLVDQTIESFWEHGIRDIGAIQANHVLTDWSKPVQVASVQTLIQRQELPEADIVLIDEVHKWFSAYEQWLTSPGWQNIPVIGLSATPWTRGLGAYFSKFIVASTIEECIKLGLLSPFRVFVPAHPDLTGVRTVAGDYHATDLGEAMDKGKLVADIVESWGSLGEGRPTICFAVNRAHAEHIAQRFEAAGIPSGYMDCDTPLHERQQLRKRFKAGDIKVVCNVDVMGMGVDWPEVSCIVYARPTRSEMRFVQNIGRGLRICPGKKDCVIIDHSDTHLKLGFVTDIHHNELHDGKTRAVPERNVLLPKECPQCAYLKPPRAAVCPNCGHKCEQHAKQIEKEKHGQLEEFKGRKASPSAARFPDQRQTYEMLLGHAASKGYSHRWAFHKYKTIYGKEPYATRGAVPRAPSMELASWIKSQQIAWAKSKRREENGNGHAKGALTDREHALVDKVREQYVGSTLCTEDDLADFGRM